MPGDGWAQRSDATQRHNKIPADLLFCLGGAEKKQRATFEQRAPTLRHNAQDLGGLPEESPHFVTNTHRHGGNERSRETERKFRRRSFSVRKHMQLERLLPPNIPANECKGTGMTDKHFRHLDNKAFVHCTNLSQSFRECQFRQHTPTLAISPLPN